MAIKNYIFSGYIKGQFKSVGKNFYIQYPLVLIGGKYITIGNNFDCMTRFRLEVHDYHMHNQYTPEVSIGSNVQINYDCHFTAINKIVIGDNVLIASKVFITDHYHGKIDEKILNVAPKYRDLHSSGPVYIGSNVWIGENVSIMPNVTIGNNCIVGANAVVTKSFPPNSIIAGVPGRIIKSI